MSGDTPILTCAEVENLGPELATGTLSGGERASALEHLESCARCRQFVDDLSSVADALLLLAPEAEPPIGFESRAAARIAAAAAAPSPTEGSAPVVPITSQTPRRRRLIAVAAAAFVAGALGAGTFAWWASGRDHQPGTVTSPIVRTAVVRTTTQNGRYTCHAMVVGTNPAWLYMSMTQPNQHDGQYRVEGVGLTTTIPLGTIDVRSGRGAIGVVLKDISPTDLTELRVFDSSGVLRYQAKFTTTKAPDAPTSTTA
jgi:hypothetical protein